jgi:hypothetical protein
VGLLVHLLQLTGGHFRRGKAGHELLRGLLSSRSWAFGLLSSRANRALQSGVQTVSPDLISHRHRRTQVLTKTPCQFYLTLTSLNKKIDKKNKAKFSSFLDLLLSDGSSKKTQKTGKCKKVVSKGFQKNRHNVKN